MLKRILRNPWLISGLLVSMAVPALLYFLVLQPQAAELERLAAEQGGEESDYVRLKVQAESVERLSEDVVRLRKLVDERYELLTGDAGDNSFYTELETEAKKHDVQIQSIVPGTKGVAVEGYLDGTPVAVEVWAGYHDFARFLRALEDSAKYAVIDGLEIQSVTPGQSKSRIRFTLHLFSRAEAPANPAGA